MPSGWYGIYMIWYGIVLHGGWSLLMLTYGELHTTTINLTLTWLGLTGATCVYWFSAAAAFLALRANGKSPFATLCVIALSLQQVLILFSLEGPLLAIIGSAYADGEPRSRGFIAADQLTHFILAVCHLLAVRSIAGRWLEGAKQECLSAQRWLRR